MSSRRRDALQGSLTDARTHTHTRSQYCLCVNGNHRLCVGATAQKANRHALFPIFESMFPTFLDLLSNSQNFACHLRYTCGSNSSVVFVDITGDKKQKSIWEKCGCVCRSNIEL